MKTISLNKQARIPILGFGTWQLQGEECRSAVAKALEVGYRHIDTADAYDNHQVIADVINKSGIPRKELFITTKIWREDLAAQDIEPSVTRFLKELNIEYIDLLLIHWPDSTIPIGETLEAMQKLEDLGLIKAKGVSNFTVNHLQEAVDTHFDITNNQVELHPSLQQPQLQQFCRKNGISLTAYSPIAQGKDLQLKLIQLLSQKYSVTPAQIILNWFMAKNIVVIPRSHNPQHIEENYHSIDFELSKEDIAEIDKLDQGNRLISPSFAEFND
jgi:2,5-diketo-D-gluconate reductase B